MKKQEIYNHKKTRKLLDQVRDVMRLKHYAFRIEGDIFGINTLSFVDMSDVTI